jgi:hypothetical protein
MTAFDRAWLLSLDRRQPENEAIRQRPGADIAFQLLRALRNAALAARKPARARRKLARTIQRASSTRKVA